MTDSRARCGDTLALRYLYGGTVNYRPGDRLAPRLLSDYELVLMLEGTAHYGVDGQVHEAPPGSVILARPGFRETYRWDPRIPTRHAYFHFDIERFPPDWPPPERWPVLERAPDPVVAPLFRHVVERIAGHPDWPTMSPGVDDCRLMECLLRILLHPATGTPRVVRNLPEPVHQALNLMREVLDGDAHRPVRLEDLARRAGVTGKHLCRLFQQALGHSPMQTFRLLKLQLALPLLGRSSLAVKEIADRCGFENPLYFTRCFTQTFGRAPTAVRQALLTHQPPPPSPLPPEITPRLHW